MRLGREVRRHLAAGRADLAWDAAARDFIDGDYVARQAARRRLRELAPLLHPDAWSTARLRLFTQREAAGSLVHRASVRPDIGWVEFPVGAADSEASRFIAVDASLADGADSLPDGLAPESLSSAQDALDAVRRLEPGAYFRVQVEARRWTGDSWSLAVGLAALSAVRGVRVCTPATGRLHADGRITTVGSAAAKRRLRSEARPRTALVVPKAWDFQDPKLLRCGSLQDAWAAAAAVPRDLTLELDRVRAHQRDGAWDAAAALAGRLQDSTAWEAGERAELLVALLESANHTNDAESCERWSSRLTGLVGATGGLLEARTVGHLAVAAIDRFDLQAADRILNAVDVDQLQPPARVHVLGPRALLCQLRGLHHEAVALRRQSLDGAAAAERARCLGDLADALRRAGHLKAAVEAIDKAHAASNGQRRVRYQHLTRRFLYLHQARVLLALGRPSKARAKAHQGLPSPGLDPAIRLKLLLAELGGGLNAVQRVRKRFAPRAGSLVEALCDATAASLGDAQAEARLLGREVFGGLSLEEARRRLPY